MRFDGSRAFSQCSGEVPCVGCRENIGAKIWKSPCIKADFIDIVEAGSCNYICVYLQDLLYIEILTDLSTTADQPFHS